MRAVLAALTLTTLTWGLPAQAAELPADRTGTVEYQPAANEEIVAELFRLEPHTFNFEQKFDKSPAPKMEFSRVTFPSPVVTPQTANNTVHTEYFRPLSEGKHPGVIVLHILGGDFELSRMFCRQLAMKNVASLFLILPHYGPREEPGSGVKMISPDPYLTLAGMRQAILDIRRAGAWLGAQEEVDPEQLGIMGISLGGITSALAGTAEPRFKKMFLMLAGGDLGRIGWESDEVAEFREAWLAKGGTKEQLLEILRPIDPVQYGQNVRDRKILMLNAKHDEIVPPECSESLWEAFGKPEIIWFDAGHYSAMRFIPGALNKAAAFFQPDQPADEKAS